MKCKRCDAELAEGAIFCPACGEDNRAQTPPELTDADIQASRDAVRVLTERADELRPEAITQLVTDAQAPLREEMASLRAELEKVQVAAQRIRTATTDDDDAAERRGGYASFGEFLRSIEVHRVDHELDPRLREIQKRALSMGVGAAGGFLVPPEFSGMLRQIQPQDAMVRPRATVLPPSTTAPDASVTMPVLNQGAAGVYSGVTVNWIGEAGTKHDTEPSFGEITLNPHEVAGSTTLSDKLLRNSDVGPLVMDKLRLAINASEDVAFMTGNGVARPLGVIGHASVVNVARAGAAAVVYADITAMYWRLLRSGGQPTWLCNPSVLPQLMNMVGPGVGVAPAWQASARDSEPDRLFGIPLFYNQRQPVLGQIGDIILCDWSYYYIKDGYGIAVQTDNGSTNFLTNQTIIKAFWNVDGQPSVTAPLLLEDGVNTVSPFVVLN